MKIGVFEVVQLLFEHGEEFLRFFNFLGDLILLKGIVLEFVPKVIQDSIGGFTIHDVKKLYQNGAGGVGRPVAIDECNSEMRVGL